METRHQRLIQLRDFLNSGNEQYNVATALEVYFLDKRSGCNCKYNVVRSELNQFWHTTGKQELENYENNSH